jgi:hypothetical protein
MHFCQLQQKYFLVIEVIYFLIKWEILKNQNPNLSDSNQILAGQVAWIETETSRVNSSEGWYLFLVGRSFTGIRSFQKWLPRSSEVWSCQGTEICSLVQTGVCFWVLGSPLLQ